MAEKLPLDELSGAIGRIRRPLLTEEKVDVAVELLAKAIKDSVPGTIGAGVSVLDTQAAGPAMGPPTGWWKRRTRCSTTSGKDPA